ncbi:MAG: CPBP family intramembrane glutamic endopeptidase [Bacteroidales bacterium]
MMVAGAFIGMIITLIISTISKIAITELNPLLTYLLPLIPPFLYIVYKGNEIAASHPEQIPVPLDKGHFGKMNIVLFLILCVLVQITTGIVTEPLTGWIPMSETIKKLFEQIMQNSGWSIITTVIAAPMIEEFFLRGIITRGLLAHQTPAKAILWSAFFFALIHFNIWQAIPAFATGVFLGWIYWKTNSLKTCIFIHMTNNGLASYLYYKFPDIKIDTTTQELLTELGANIYPIVYVASIAILAISIYYLHKSFEHE